MIRVNIKNLQDKITHFARFETQEKVDAWIASIEAKPKAWGYLKERWELDYEPQNQIVSQEDKDEALDTRVVVIQEFRAATQVEELDFDGEPTGEMIDIPEQPLIEATEYLLPAHYTIEQVDITAEVEADAAEQASHDADKIAVRAMISNINSSSKPAWEKRLLKTLIRQVFGR